LLFTQVRRDLVYGGTEHADTYRVKRVHATGPSRGRQRRFPEKIGEKYMKSLQIALSEGIVLTIENSRSCVDKRLCNRMWFCSLEFATLQGYILVRQLGALDEPCLKTVV
jgi:hypothetical protein